MVQYLHQREGRCPRASRLQLAFSGCCSFVSTRSKTCTLKFQFRAFFFSFDFFSAAAGSLARLGFREWLIITSSPPALVFGIRQSSNTFLFCDEIGSELEGFGRNGSKIDRTETVHRWANRWTRAWRCNNPWETRQQQSWSKPRTRFPLHGLFNSRSATLPSSYDEAVNMWLVPVSGLAWPAN